MIAGYTRNGCSKEVMKLFEQMEYLGISYIKLCIACL